MSTPKWREVEYSDDGCCYYQCLMCYQTWEGRSSPEYGCNFCPYCGIKWMGQNKCRARSTDKWKWELYLKYFPDNIDYTVMNSYEDKIQENYKQIDGQKLIWVMEYQESNGKESNGKESSGKESSGKESSRKDRELNQKPYWERADHFICKVGGAKFALKELKKAKHDFFEGQWRNKENGWQSSLKTREWRVRLVRKSEYNQNSYSYIPEITNPEEVEP